MTRSLRNLKLACITLTCLSAVAFTAVNAKVLFPELPTDANLACIIAGKQDGKVQKGNDCNIATYDQENEIGLLPDGKCVQCGDVKRNFDLECDAGTPAITFVKGDFRLCACSIGFYGQQFASGCKQCPVGYTTTGYGATSITDCNICATGFIRKAGKCVACGSLFRGRITTTGPGDNTACVCPKGFTGKPGQCKPCIGYEVTTAYPGAQTCLCPAGGKPPFCIPCKEGFVLGDKCVCPAGKTGVWPKCVDCPTPWQYQVTTDKPGNNQQCVCNLASEVEDTPLRYLAKRSPKDGSCTCREDTGHYLKAVPNLVWNSEWSSGPCDNPTKDDKGVKIVNYDGRNRLGCDAKNGFGASLARVVFIEGGSGPLCLKCSGNAYIDPKTTKCFCKQGYAVNPLFGKLGEKNSRLAPLFNTGYCMKCDHPSLTIGTLPYTARNDTFCRCNWEKGYYGTPDTFSFRGECQKCPDEHMVVDTQTGMCKCEEGWYKEIMDDGTSKCLKNPTCKEGEELDSDGKCVCRLVREASGSCAFPGDVCSKLRLSYWTNVNAADGKFPFSSTLLLTPTVDYLERGWSAINTTTDLVTLSPQIKACKCGTKNIALLVDGCFCSRTLAENVVEMSSVGSARLDVHGDDVSVLINQSKFHTTTATTYASVESGRYDRCIKFSIFYYSGNANGALKLRTVPFGFEVQE